MLALLLIAAHSPVDVPNPKYGGDPFAPGGYSGFGLGLADVGDLDGDARDEFSVSDPYGSPATVWILSGDDAHVVARLWSPLCTPEFGRHVARIPDIDDDGVDEIAVTAPPERWTGLEPGMVFLYAGRTQTLLRTIVAPRGVESFGTALAGLPDIDGDGHGDLAVMSADSRSERCGFVYSGRSAEALFELWRPAWLVTSRMLSITDVDGDRRSDLVLTGTDVVAKIPVAIVYSGRDGRVLEELRGESFNVSHDVRALVLDDLDHQGMPDLMLLAGALIDTVSTERRCVLFSTRTSAWSYELYQAACGLLGDVDGDGVRDFVITDPEDGLDAGSAACRSGRTGALLWQLPPWDFWRNVQLNRVGKELAVIGDFDRDGVRDFIWAAENLMNGSPGLVFISSGKTGRLLRVLARGPNLEILRLGPAE